MKYLFKAAMFSAALFVAGQSRAQTTHKDSTFSKKVDTRAKKVGYKTSEIAANGASAVTDKKYEGKCGPEGQTVYINKFSHYYYISKKGHKMYLKKSQLMDKKM